jgi:hypothetical protein
LNHDRDQANATGSRLLLGQGYDATFERTQGICLGASSGLDDIKKLFFVRNLAATQLELARSSVTTGYSQGGY